MSLGLPSIRLGVGRLAKHLLVEFPRFTTQFPPYFCPVCQAPPCGCPSVVDNLWISHSVCQSSACYVLQVYQAHPWVLTRVATQLPPCLPGFPSTSLGIPPRFTTQLPPFCQVYQTPPWGIPQVYHTTAPPFLPGLPSPLLCSQGLPHSCLQLARFTKHLLGEFLGFTKQLL